MRSSPLSRAALGLLGLAALLSCSGLEPVEPYTPIVDPSKLFLRLQLDHRAVNLSTVAPYDTFQLTATPLDGAGNPMSGLPAARFRSSDTTRVWVSPDGLLQARGSATGVSIFAEIVTADNIRQVDTARVNVRATAPPPGPATLSIDPVPPDSAIRSIVPLGSVNGLVLLATAGVSFSSTVRARVLDAMGNPITGLQVAYESLDPSVASVNRSSGAFAVLRPGQARFVARTVVYGVSLADTVTYTMTFPVINAVRIMGMAGDVPTFDTEEVVIRQNGYVFWTNLSPDSTAMDVMFDDPTNVMAIPALCTRHGGDHCLAGNIPSIPGGTPDNVVRTRGRRFPVPGVYPYRSTRTGETGRVVVLAD